MPAFYAHQKFGEEVLCKLPDEVKTKVLAYKEAFLLGTQSPDILFNFKPLSKNETNAKALGLHLASAKALFMRAHTFAHEQGGAYLAYSVGLICHFSLDNACHPDIYRLEYKGFDHGRIESELDKFLKTHYHDEVFCNAAKPLSHKNGASEAAADILQVEEKAIKKAVRTMRTVNGLFSIKSKTWQRFAGWVLKKANKTKFFGMFLHIEGLPETDALNPILHKRFADAIAPTASLVKAFLNEKPFVEFFDAFDKDYKGEPIE